MPASVITENTMNARSLTEEMDREIDLAVAGSFPASDPPPWTLGATPLAASMPELHPPAASAPATIDVVIAAGRGRRRIATVLEALVLAALLPAGVLLVAAPILLAVWSVAVASAWLMGGR